MDVWSSQIVLPAARNLTEPEMRKQAQVMRERADAIEADLDKQAQTRTDKLEEAAVNEEQRAERHKRLWFTEEEGIEIEYDENGWPKF